MAARNPSDVQRALGRIEGTLDAMQKQQGAAFSKIDGLKKDFADVKGDVSTIKSEVGTLKNNHDHHDARIKAVEKDSTDSKIGKAKVAGAITSLTIGAGVIAFLVELVWKALVKGGG